jgi:predicted enzyme related to lactoylglutathione lyase
MSNRPVHFEIPCDDPQKTMDFFSRTFGWKFEKFGPMEYWSVVTGAEGEPGINGGLMKKNDPRQPIVNVIDVKDLDAKVKEIEQNGGTIVVPKMPIPGVGYVAYFKDPDGNIHGVYQNDPSVPAQ